VQFHLGILFIEEIKVKPTKTKAKVSADCSTHDHPDHSKEIRRLNRAIGQLEGVRRMVEERRYCHDILIQTKAVTSAIRAIESNVLERHIRHCVATAVSSTNTKEKNQKIEELVDLFVGRIKKQPT